MDGEWESLGKRWKNSVLQLIVTYREPTPRFPYLMSPPFEKRGTGFIIDVCRGLVVTNAHVAEGAIVITGRSPKTGKADLSLDVIGICFEKDLALCRLSSQDIERFSLGPELNLAFGDSLNVSQGEEVLALGYPLGDLGIQFTTGVISGFKSVPDPLDGIDNNFETFEDISSRRPTYLQVTSALNPGSSGGPLLNRSGLVIGINSAGKPESQEIGYAIPSRSFQSIFPNLLAEFFVSVPSFAFSWNLADPDLLPQGFKGGIQIRKIENSSFLKRNSCLRKKDILLSICLQGFNLHVSQFGDLVPSNFEHRKITFAEFVDALPLGSEISFKVLRPEKEGFLLRTETVTYSPSPDCHPISNCRTTDPDFQIVAGLCIRYLCSEHLRGRHSLPHARENSKESCSKQLVICYIFPGTLASRKKVLYEGDCPKKVNGISVRTLDELRRALSLPSPRVEISVRGGAVFSIGREEMRREDHQTISKFLPGCLISSYSSGHFSIL